MARLRQLSFLRGLTLIALAGFAFRIAYVLIWRQDHLPFGGDSIQYSVGANLLARGHGFVSGLAAIGGEYVPTAQHPPLYILWLAIPSWFANGHATELTHVLWTCVLDIGTIVLVGLTARDIAGQRVGLIAAGLAAFYPNIWINDGVLLSEPMAIFTVTLVVWTTYRFLKRPTIAWAAAIGAACGLAALARSELLILAPILLIPVALFRRGAPVGARLSWLVAGGVAAVLVVSPWIVYNQGRFKEHVLFTTNFGGTLAAANCKQTYYGPNIGFKNYECGQHFLDLFARQGEDESQQDKGALRGAKTYIKAHLGRVPIVVAARLGRTLGVFRPNDDVVSQHAFYRVEPFVAHLSIATYYVLFSLAIAGGFVLRRRRVPIYPLLALAGVVLVAIALTFAQPRYRAPAEIAIILLASVAIDAIIDRWRGPTRTMALPATESGAVQLDAAIASST